MKLNGKSYKSLKFSVLFDKLNSREKKQTFRCLFVPNFQIGETIAIMFGEQFLYLAKVTEVYPKRICDVTLDESIQDGFDSVEEFRKGLMKINNIKFMEHWGFVIRFEPLEV